MNAKRFNQYEFQSIVIPGAALILAWLALKGQTDLVKAMSDVSVGGLGLFAIVCFVAGHLIQVFGNVLVGGWWRMRGMPSTWLIGPRNSILTFWRDAPLLSVAQRDRVFEGLENLGIIASRSDLQNFRKWEWEGLTAEVYARVAAAGRQQRVDIFNSVFGLHRGLVIAAAGALGCAMTSSGDNDLRWRLVFALIIALVLAWIRMSRFARHYARELYVQFLTTLDSSNTSLGRDDANEA